MGNPISHGTANDENVIVQVTYDKAGRRVAVRDPRGEQTTYTYDQLDRRISLSNPLDQTWTTAHSDLSGGRRRVTRTNPLGQQVEEDYDRLGRLVAVRYLNETPKHTPDVVFRYDAAGNRTAMDETLDGGVTWLRKTQYGYDGVGRLVNVGFDTNGDGVVEATVTYQYDAGGRRTHMTLPGNKTVQYAYDVKGQLVSLTDWDGQVTRYRYDNAGRLREAQGANLLTRRWRYDAAGRLRHLRHSREGKTLGDFAYEVDRRGNRTQARECLPQAAVGTTVLTHSSPAIDYLRGTWAAVGDFRETANMGAALRTEVFGTELILVMGAGPDHSVYDVYLNGTLRDSLDGYAATPDERSLSYSLTDEGPHTVEVRNRTDRNLVSSGYKLRFKSLTTNRRYDLHTLQYGYDKLERLRAADYHPATNLSAAPFRQHGYAYDVAGNRTQVNDNGAITNSTYNAANQITNPGFSYDTAGRMTSDGVNTYTWDRADRLLSMGGVQNQYNGVGQRVQQSVGAQVTQYLLDTQPGLWQVLAATTGTDTTRYVHGPTGLQQQQNPDNAWLYPTQDALGSVRSVAGADMAVLESRHYEPYGETWGVTGTPQTDFGFTGEPTDDNELVYLRARHYSPMLGMFLSLDPLESEHERTNAPHRYNYAAGNPASQTDPSGLAPVIGGYIEGISLGVSGGLGTSVSWEVVYNFATFQRTVFKVDLGSGLAATAGAGVSGTWYFGHVEGFTRHPQGGYKFLPTNEFNYLPDNPNELFEHFIRQYRGQFYFEQGGVGFKLPILPSLTAGVIHFHSPDNSIYGNNVYISGGWMPITVPGVDASAGATFSREEVPYFSDLPLRENYVTLGCKVDRNTLTNHILSGAGSPHGHVGIPIASQVYRVFAAAAADIAAQEWNNHVPQVCPPVDAVCTGLPIPLVPQTPLPR